MAAQSEDQVTRGLKWFLISAQVFLRVPKRGGKKSQGFGEIASRFDCFVRGDWGSLLAMLARDKAALTQRRGRKRQKGRGDPSQESAKLRKTVLAFLSRGQVGRAVRRICSHGMASMEDPVVRAALQSKYTVRGRDLPASVTKGECLPSLGGLRETILGLATGVSPGFGGCRNEHLR